MMHIKGNKLPEVLHINFTWEGILPILVCYARSSKWMGEEVLGKRLRNPSQ